MQRRAGLRLALASLLLLPSALHAQWQFGYAEPQVRVWPADGPHVLDRGQPLTILVQTSAPAFVAVLRIDTRGQVDLLFPVHPRDNGLIRSGRPVVVRQGRFDYWRIDEPPGVAYVFAVASPEPLDFRALWRLRDDHLDMYGRYYRDRPGAGWSIFGDPFLEMERIADALGGRGFRLPAIDAFSYFVGGRHPFPHYACYDGPLPPAGLRQPTYPACDWLRDSLRRFPDYYDTWRYRGERNFFDRRPRREDLRR